MFGLNSNRLFRLVLPWAIFLAAAQLLSAGVILQFPLPTANLNQGAGASRTNASVIEGSFAGSPPVPYINGEAFQLSTPYVVDSLTVWAIANSPTSPGPIHTLGQEFNSFSLYTGYTADSGTTWNQVGSYSLNPTQLTAAPRAYYNGTTDYQSLASSTYYPMYAVTFNGLNWSIPAGQIAYFGVGGDPIGSNTLALSVSTYNNSTQFSSLYFLTGSPWAPKFEDASNSINNFTQVAALNFSISDANAGVPEPSTFGFLGLGIAGLVIKLRRRK